MYKKRIVTTDDDYKEFDCYSDGSYWNGAANILFTEKQLTAWLEDSPYTFRVVENGAYILFEDEDFVPVVTFTDENGEQITAYDMNGYSFMFIEDLTR